MNLKKRLIVTIGIVLFLAWFVVALWVWHETNEQLDIIGNQELTAHERIEAVSFEIREIFIALTIPIFMIMFLAMLTIIALTNRFLRPLVELAEQLEAKNDLNLIEVQEKFSSREANIIIDRLNRLLERIHQRIEYEKQFTADVAHELRTPLAGIRLNIELMEDVPEKPLLIARIDDLLITIEQLLQFARASHEFNSNEAHVFTIYDNIVLPLKAEYEEDFPHPLIWNLPQNLMLKGDPSLIYLLLKNLLDNVRFYAASGKETTITFKVLKDNILLEVTDNGPGVAEESLTYLTERYKRLDQSRAGFGLGLNLVERIATVHQATLSIENRKDDRSGLSVRIYFQKL